MEIERHYSNATTLAAGTFTEADIGRLFQNDADGEVFFCVAATPKFVHAYSLKNAQHTITYGATITPNVLNGLDQVCTLTGNVTVAVPTVTAGVVVGTRFRLRLIQDGTGSRVITLAAGYHLAGGAPTESTGAADVDIMEATYDGTQWNATFGVNFVTS